MNSDVSRLNEYWTDIYFYLHYPHKEKITHQVVRILQIVDKRKEVGVSEIASDLHISHNTASEHVKRIIDKKYLNKKRDALDERKVILSLTDLGKEVLHRNTSLDEGKLEQIMSQLDENEKNGIERALKTLSERAKQCM
ncbi:MarR family transcriptional regulator [Bacillaceae bacterium SIJ1]|uniref:MarR family winged helix-turn-helix transcriptional regulator n=1 Tax=Litoribacterium kuwaitense TaxID=1398745 RepID=UPI0013E9E049|nr:MarR family transcriptional regulator [Litoribacterium kuwaitense]NGP43975.1 MarR family transcriptional regulator [Litoribacterium kuwaitense]